MFIYWALGRVLALESEADEEYNLKERRSGGRIGD